MQEDSNTTDAKQMIANLVADQKVVVESARRVIEAAEAVGDQASADLGVRRIEVHEKNAWMLRVITSYSIHYTKLYEIETLQSQLGLGDAQVEHEGRGYVQSNDVVNAGFLQGETSYVAVEVVYDELAMLDDLEGVEITPVTRELTPKDPLDLNLMHITRNNFV